MTEQLAIQTRGLIKNYGRVRALRGLNLEVRRGEIFGIAGLLGSGRTEVLEAIFGVYPGRTSGTILIEGKLTYDSWEQDGSGFGVSLT